MPIQPDGPFIKGLYEKLRQRARMMAPQVDTNGQTKDLTPDEISLLWNRRHIPIEQEWELWRQGRTPETADQPQLTREEIGLMVFKDREKLAKMGGRIEPKEFVLWANKQAEKEAAKRAAAAEVAPALAPEGTV